MLLTQDNALPAEDYVQFKAEFEKLAGIDLNLYKEKQMKRRIDTLISRKGFGDYQNYLQFIKKNDTELAFFLDYITINVTEFFRTPEHWKVMEQIALSDLIAHSARPITVWSCACSTGEEPYSMAMTLSAHLPLSDVKILATDIDETVIRKAKAGIYPQSAVELPDDELRRRCFVACGPFWQVRPEIRSCVTIQKLNLLKDPFPSDCDLIVCRNVLIYFTEEAKDRLYQQFMAALKPGGYLFTGSAEQLIYYRKYGLEKKTGYLYNKPL